MADAERWKADQARIWGAGSWQEVAERQLFPVHEELVRRLGPRPGERWLDLATGTGAVALRAARAGADVAGLDLAPALIATARRLAGEQGLGVRFDVGDVERLPYADAAFDVVSSAHGAVFAADHAAVARELARVCRPGGRLGLTYWRPDPELGPLWERFGSTRPAGADRPADWARPEYVHERLGGAFELELVEASCPWTGASGEAIWQLTVTADGPAKTALAALPPAEREALRRDWVECFERHRTAEGIRFERLYLLVLGVRRAAG
jgi:SAM-dependent methyltransferase